MIKKIEFKHLEHLLQGEIEVEEKNGLYTVTSRIPSTGKNVRVIKNVSPEQLEATISEMETQLRARMRKTITNPEKYKDNKPDEILKRLGFK